jgi:hypothetical protein
MYKSICENWPVEKESLDIIWQEKKRLRSRLQT